MADKNAYRETLKQKMDEYVHLVYKVTRNFPAEERFGSASQLRRSALSVILNYIEGFARIRLNVKLNFLEIAYGSLKESKYLIYFSMKEGYIFKEDYQTLIGLADNIGAMLWSEIAQGSKKRDKN
ncbi:MAG: four helix bundle protein [Patescibacteria group bacterium]|nr:four helix bundle protein [Patescibacteria group bacterium]